MYKIKHCCIYEDTKYSTDKEAEMMIKHGPEPKKIELEDALDMCYEQLNNFNEKDFLGELLVFKGDGKITNSFLKYVYYGDVLDYIERNKENASNRN